MFNGKSLTQNISYHKTGKGSLSSVLEKEVNKKYYLSEKMIKFLIKRMNERKGVYFDSDRQESQPLKTRPETYSGETFVIQKTSGQNVSIKKGETGTLQAGGSNVRDKTPNVLTEIGNIYSKKTGGVKTGLYLMKEKEKIFSKIRRLTPLECERLQGFPDNWTKFGKDKDGKQTLISDTQRYKQMGNAVSVPVITAIGKKILKNFNKLMEGKNESI
jgi:site-specific DNA-cytosine methylase